MIVMKYNYFFFLLLLVCSCTHSGNEKLSKYSDQFLKTMLVKNVTTKEQVIALLSEPNDEDFFEHGREKYVYITEKNKVMFRNFIPFVGFLFNSSEKSKRKLVIWFKNYKISNYVITETKDILKTNIEKQL